MMLWRFIQLKMEENGVDEEKNDTKNLEWWEFIQNWNCKNNTELFCMYHAVYFTIIKNFIVF